MKSSKSHQKFLLLGLILIFGLASGCGKTDPQPMAMPVLTPTPANNIPPINEGPSYSCSWPEQPSEFSRNKGEGIMEGEIVFTGDPEKIQEVVDYNFSYFESNVHQIEIELPLVKGFDESLVIRLYQLQGSISVWEAVVEMNTYISNESIHNVFAEPNYVNTLPISASDPCGGCSGGIGGDPTGILTRLEYGKQNFLNQWAFSFADPHNASISLYDTLNSWTAKDSAGTYLGQDIDVVIFDTVPTIYQQGKERIHWASIPFDLCIWKPGYMFDSDERSLDPKNIDLQDHGLFVAGLAQGVAPSARYTLIEVLNSEAEGDMISLLNAMNEYVFFERDIEDFNLNNTVINLSLGLELEIKRMYLPEDDLVDIQDALEPLRELLNQTEETSDDWDKYIADLKERPYPSVALNMALSTYEQYGAMIVGAAGNDNGTYIQDPAGFSSVLGVSSSNFDKGLSCFSNYGDVAAPGGDGDLSRNCYINLKDLCSKYIADGNIDKCPFAVISIISNNPADPAGGSGFGYWAGTSMSTPMVSGLAALLFEQCPNITPADVRELIKNAAYPKNEPGLGAGIINVETTIAQGCQCPSPP